MTQVAEHALLTGVAPHGGAGTATWPYALLLARRYREAVDQLDAPVPGGPLADAVRDLVGAACRARAPQHLGDALPEARDEAYLVRYLRAETAMTAGLVAESERLAAAAIEVVPADLPWYVMARLVRARSLAFLGRLTESKAEAEAVAELARSHRWAAPALVADSVTTFAAAHLGDVAAVESWAESLRLRVPTARSFGEQMAYLLGALALSAAGRPTAGAELLFGSCGGRGLPDLPLFARAYAVDVMVEGAIGTAQIAVAAEYVRLADGFDVSEHPMADAALDRARARLAVVVGDAVVAAEHAQQSGRRAEDVGGALYVIRARLLHAVAERESGDPAAAAEAARLASEVGPGDVTAWAERELEGLGTESRPVPGIGWDQLDERRQLVARLAAQGRRNREIAELMHVSVKTVERDVSEILRLMSATRRIDLVQIVPGTAAGTRGIRLPLTQRQTEVASRVALGLTNAEIGDSLGLTVKAVEKHVSAIFERLGVESRTAIAAALHEDPPAVR